MAPFALNLISALWCKLQHACGTGPAVLYHPVSGIMRHSQMDGDPQESAIPCRRLLSNLTVRFFSVSSGERVVPEEDVGGPGAAIKGLGAGISDDPFPPGPGSKPGLNAIFQYGFRGRGKAASVNDENGPLSCRHRFFEKCVKG